MKIKYGVAAHLGGYKDEERKQGYINKHKKNESIYWNKSRLDTPSFWSISLLLKLPKTRSSYQDIY